MIEAGGTEVEESLIVEAVSLAQEPIGRIIQAQKELFQKLGIKKRSFTVKTPDPARAAAVAERVNDVLCQTVETTSGMECVGAQWLNDDMGFKNGTLAYHLRTLERESFIFSRMDGIYRRFYPSGLDPSRVRLRSAVTETHRRIMELIEQSPGITPKELAERLGASHQVASYHIRILARRGRIRLEQKGRNTLCYLPVAGAGGAGH